MNVLLLAAVMLILNEEDVAESDWDHDRKIPAYVRQRNQYRNIELRHLPGEKSYSGAKVRSHDPKRSESTGAYHQHCYG